MSERTNSTAVRKSRLLRASPVVAMVGVVAIPATSAAKTFAEQYFATRKECYAGVFGEVHFRARPKQTVTRFFVRWQDLPATASLVRAPAGPQPFAVQFGFSLKNTKNTFSATATCVPDKNAVATCDAPQGGGRFAVIPRGDHVIVRVTPGPYKDNAQGLNGAFAKGNNTVLVLGAASPEMCR